MIKTKDHHFLNNLADQIAKLYYNQIYPVIKDFYDCCVIDLRYNNCFWNILDINSNDKKYGTSSCLFSWQDDEDLLENKKFSYYHFRVCF